MELQKTNQGTTSTALWKASNAEMVQLLQADRFETISKSVSNKVNDLLQCEPIESVIRYAGEAKVKAYIEHELVTLAANVNVNAALNLKDYQVPVIAQGLIENYKWESVEDFTLCFRKAAAGMYGEIFRLDGAVIGQWMSRYLDEKYDAFEQRKAKFKPEKTVVRETNSAHADACIKQILENLGAPVKKEENNASENAYQREKLTYTPPSKEEVLKRELHIQWVRENYDPISGKAKPNWISEEDWLKDKL